MPEAVEVRKFSDIVRANVLGHKITHINILKGRYTKKPFEGYNELVKTLPLRIDSIDTKGKFTYMTLSKDNTNNEKKDDKDKIEIMFYINVASTIIIITGLLCFLDLVNNLTMFNKKTDKNKTFERSRGRKGSLWRRIYCLFSICNLRQHIEIHHFIVLSSL